MFGINVTSAASWKLQFSARQLQISYSKISTTAPFPKQNIDIVPVKALLPIFFLKIRIVDKALKSILEEYSET